MGNNAEQITLDFTGVKTLFVPRCPASFAKHHALVRKL